MLMVTKPYALTGGEFRNGNQRARHLLCTVAVRTCAVSVNQGTR